MRPRARFVEPGIGLECRGTARPKVRESVTRGAPAAGLVRISYWSMPHRKPLLVPEGAATAHKNGAANSATLSALSVSGDGHGVTISTASFLSGSTPVRVEMFGPEGDGDYPAVLVLHGAGGIDAGNKYVRQFGAAIAAHGVVALLIHYFDRTGTTYAGDATIHREFPAWLETIRDAVTYATKLPNVAPDRLGLVGYSLGGYLAMAHATQDERIRAVVELAGGIDAESARNARRFPPVLVVHGKDDRRVPFERAKEVQRIWKEAEAEIDTRFYPGEGHILSAGAALDALSAGLQFLGAHLGVAVAG